ncbi:FHA domain-containing protein [Actinosynnema sp. NPDC047251]|uniref:FHA domain-containing protein n=1 Tax=Saccharothrix espanaensis (strain ATCC 51144 / DSM 44229 / JCM 9112 / NBRC 15066 / NRRL 15764) TaxID=1179773 RepID=K0K1P6_SACES|nr:FHA domain-containing protein [Saccharothrix espanaensis]CCH31492.1 FHA domain-containing protein [Saccharothrix espanaensis DSM 44229]
MATCPAGHASATDDYCDVCGTPLDAAASSPAPSAAPAAEETCAACGAARPGRFCEECGHDSLAPAPAGDPTPAPVVAAPARARWHATVEADRAYHLRVVAVGGPDAAAVEFPEFCPPRRFDLVGPQVTIGRRSRSRGIFPTVDLVGPPEDPGVSHSHALLVSADGEWSVVDLGSTNGTTVNDEEEPVKPNRPRRLAAGDRVHVGAWTTITLHHSE